MKKIGLKRSVLMILAFAIAFIVAMALLWTPQEHYEVKLDTFEVIEVLEMDDIHSLHSCEIDEEGNVTVVDGDPYIIFTELETSSSMVKVNFAEPLEEDARLEVYINEGYGFNEGLKSTQLLEEGDTYAYVHWGDYRYIDIRIDVESDFKFENIEIGTVEYDAINLTNRPFWPLCAIVAGLIASVAMYFADEKKQVADRIVAFFKYVKQNFVKGILSLFVIGIISGVITLVWRGRPTFGLFEIYMFLLAFSFVFFIVCGIATLWYHRKTLVEDIEKVFVQLLLFAGLAMILLTPLAHASWDTESHYRMALETSYLGDVYWTISDLFVINLGDASLMKNDAYQHFLNAGVLTASHKGVINGYEAAISWSHLPSAICIALARLVGMPFIALFMFGKLGNLLTYTLLCYLGMRKLKSGKMLLAVIAFFPTNIFLATNYAYDWWVTGFSILGVAYFVAALQKKEEKISVLDTCIMCFALAIACYPKAIYFPLLLLPFLMPQDKMKNKKVYYVICILAFVLLMSKFFAVSTVTTSGTGDIRGGATGPADQIAYIFSDIFGYAMMLINFLMTQYLNVGNMPGYISNFAYLGIASGTSIIIFLMVMNVLFDRDEVYICKDKFVWLSRIYVILMYIGGSALVATSMYVAFTPVGSATIAGCQGRYIIPWLYPMLSLWTVNRIKPIIPRKILYLVTMAGCYGVVFYQLYTIFLPKMILMY